MWNRQKCSLCRVFEIRCKTLWVNSLGTETIFRMLQNRNVISVMISYSSAEYDYVGVAHKGGSISLMTIQKDNLGLLCGIVMSPSLYSLCSNLSLEVTSKGFNIQFLCLKTLRPMVCLEKK